VRRRTLIILSVAVIASVVLWFGLAARKAHALADRQRCASQLIALGQAILLYSNENRGSLPPSWRELCVTQDIPSQIFVCPASKATPASGEDLEAMARQLVGGGGGGGSGGGHCSYQYLGGGNARDLRPDVVLAVFGQRGTSHAEGATLGGVARGFKACIARCGRLLCGVK
jgi:hypothetical protein